MAKLRAAPSNIKLKRTRAARPSPAPTRVEKKTKPAAVNATATKVAASKAAATKAAAKKVLKVSQAAHQPVKRAPPPKKSKPKRILNTAPTQQLGIYVFGTNEAGELGLGPSAGSDDILPRLNSLLPGVVQVAAGGMHCAAIAGDGQILTWGVNDHGALGRDTTWDGGLVDVNASDDSEAGLNPKESTPGTIDMSNIPEGTVFTQITAGDSATFALTSEGNVYGWGTIRTADGTKQFQPDVDTQQIPTLISSISNVTHILAGSNHVVALTKDGSVYTWGVEEQGQLGRRSRRNSHRLVPERLGIREIVTIGVGSDHSFAISKRGKVYAWGLNNFGQTGIDSRVGEDFAPVEVATLVPNMDHVTGQIVAIVGGNKHTLALTDKGEAFAWGQLDGRATGLDLDQLPSEGLVHDSRGKPRLLFNPAQIPNIQCSHIAAGGEHSIAISKDQTEAFGWGFNNNHQTGHRGDNDVMVPTAIKHKALVGKTLTWAGAGGNFSLLASPL